MILYLRNKSENIKTKLSMQEKINEAYKLHNNYGQTIDEHVHRIIDIYLDYTGYIHTKCGIDLGYVLNKKEMCNGECISFTIIEWIYYSNCLFYDDFLKYQFQNECAYNNYKKFSWVELKFNRCVDNDENHLTNPDKISVTLLYHYYGNSGSTFDTYNLDNPKTLKLFNISTEKYNLIKMKALKDFVRYNTESIGFINNKEYDEMVDNIQKVNAAFQ